MAIPPPPEENVNWKHTPIYSNACHLHQGPQQYAFSLPATNEELELSNELIHRYGFVKEEAELIVIQRRFERGRLSFGSQDAREKVLKWLTKAALFARTSLEMKEREASGGDLTKFERIDPVSGLSLMRVLHAVQELCTTCSTSYDISECQNRVWTKKFRQRILGYPYD